MTREPTIEDVKDNFRKGFAEGLRSAVVLVRAAGDSPDGLAAVLAGIEASILDVERKITDPHLRAMRID